jgi:D-threo-aldose 1-dehydrogenase
MIVMNTIKSTGMKVPSLTFGSASLANLFKEVTNVEAMAIVEKAIQVGWRYFDTAPHYGSGLAEIRLGLGLRGLDRKEYILSTKVGRLLAPRKDLPGLEAGDFFYHENPFNRAPDYSYGGIMRSYQDSIQRLGTRYIDILYVHDIGTYTYGSTEEERLHFKNFRESGYKALEELKANGDIKAWGVGANEDRILMEVMEHTRPDMFMLANRYNLLETDRRDFFEKCHQHAVSVAVAAPFATGVLVADKKEDSLYEYGKVPSEIVNRVKSIEQVCHRYDVPIGAAALQFPLRNENVVTVTCGVQSVKQAVDNYNWADMSIPEALWHDLAELGIE